MQKIGTDCVININANGQFTNEFLVEEETKYFKVVFDMNTAADKQVLVSLFSFYLSETSALQVAFMDVSGTAEGVYAVFWRS